MKYLLKFAISLVFITLFISNVLGQSPNETSSKTVSIWSSSFWELVLKALGLIVAIIFPTLQLKNLVSKSRTNLKTDIEILKMLDETDLKYDALKEHINNSIINTYSPSEKGNFLGIKIYSWEDFIFGVMLLIIFIPTTVYLYLNANDAWAFLTGFIALIGIGGILNGLDKTNTSKKGPLENLNTDYPSKNKDMH